MRAQSNARVCAVTGASGFLGSNVCRVLEAGGWTVVRLGRNAADVPFSLGEDVDPSSLRSKGVTALVHCAYDFRPRTWQDIERTNVGGSLKLLETAREAGVEQIVLISTIAAFEGCVSMYGRAKLAIEAAYREARATILRPGLLYSDKPRGLVGTIAGILEKLPIVPVIAASQIMYTCHVEDLSRLIASVLDKRGECPDAPIPVAADEALPFKSVVKALAARVGRSPLLIPVPWSVAWAALRSVELLGIQIGLRSDSVRSLASQSLSPDFTPLRAFGVPFRKFLAAGM